jgi:hypothetical protein
VNSAPPPGGSVAHDDTRLRKLYDKLDDGRRLTPSELYRALNDALDEGYELFDLSNREARFALILVGGLNAVLFIAATQTTLAAGLSPLERRIEGVIIGIYAIFALGFVLQAVQAMRPGHYRPQYKNWSPDRSDFPRGVRYFEDVAARDTAEHWDAWTTVTLRQLNAELAVQVHSLSLKNQSRKKALRGLYTSLRIMTIVLSLILFLFVIFSLT